MDTFVWMISVCLNYCIACVCENKMASELPHEAQQVHQAPLGQGGRKRERDRKIERECVTERQETDRERDVRKEGKSEGRKNGDWEWGGGRLPTFLVFCQANERCETKKKQKKNCQTKQGWGKAAEAFGLFFNSNLSTFRQIELWVRHKNGKTNKEWNACRLRSTEAFAKQKQANNKQIAGDWSGILLKTRSPLQRSWYYTALTKLHERTPWPRTLRH